MWAQTTLYTFCIHSVSSKVLRKYLNRKFVKSMHWNQFYQICTFDQLEYKLCTCVCHLLVFIVQYLISSFYKLFLQPLPLMIVSLVFLIPFSPREYIWNNITQVRWVTSPLRVFQISRYLMRDQSLLIMLPWTLCCRVLVVDTIRIVMLEMKLPTAGRIYDC